MRLYADASALVKFVVTEPESIHLARAIPQDAEVVTSALSVVEVVRAVRLAELEDDAEVEPDEVLAGCTLVDVDLGILLNAAALASRSLKTLDSIHVASALATGARYPLELLYAIKRRMLERCLAARTMRVRTRHGTDVLFRAMRFDQDVGWSPACGGRSRSGG